MRRVQGLKDGEIRDLGAALDGLADNVYVILEIDGEKKEAANALKLLAVSRRCAADPPVCLHREFPRPPEHKMAEWLMANAPLLVDRRIGKAEADHLLNRAGNDVDVLHSELQKIDLHLPSGAPISRAAIDHVTGELRRWTPFELAAALGRRDLPGALRIADALFSVSTSMPLLVSAVGRHFWALLRIRKFLAANPAAGRAVKGWKSAEQTSAALAVGRAAGLLREGQEGRVFPVVIKPGLVDQAAAFSDAELVRILRMLMAFDVGVKTGRVDSMHAAGRSALQDLCHSIVRIRSVMNGEGGP
jgi:hypothetical protein